jgi:murein tripeptide amidase MpaA
MSYLNVIEIESALENLAAAYPDAAELIACPNRTHEGRTTHVLRIGRRSAHEADGVLLLGGVHAREWVPPDALVALAADLLEANQSGSGLAYGDKQFGAAEIQDRLENLNLFVFACVNPDGRYFSQTADPMWRKNRRPNAGSPSCTGVDLNRNFDFLWDHLARFAADSGVNTSADPCNFQVYRGPSAASEPETRNVVRVLDSFPRIRWHMDVHSAIPAILHSWGSDESQTSQPEQTFSNTAFDRVRGRANDTAYREFISETDLALVVNMSQQMNAAIKAVRADDYGVEQAFGLYPTSGASDDYAFSRTFADPSKTKVYGFTIECGHSFQPPWSEAEQVIREVSAGLIEFSLAALSLQDSATEHCQANSIALVRQAPGWNTIPIASANDDGTWTVRGCPETKV